GGGDGWQAAGCGRLRERVERRVLVRVFAVAQVLELAQRQLDRLRERLAAALRRFFQRAEAHLVVVGRRSGRGGQPAANHLVVFAGIGERLLRQAPPQLRRRPAGRGQRLQHRLVVLGPHYHQYVGEVLRRGPHQGRPVDVDRFEDVFLRGVRPSRRNERREVDAYQVDGGDAVPLQHRHMLRVVPGGQNAGVHVRV